MKAKTKAVEAEENLDDSLFLFFALSSFDFCLQSCLILETIFFTKILSEDFSKWNVKWKCGRPPLRHI